MSWWSATERYGLTAAPDGLVLVQDFLNTRAIEDYGVDLLRTAESASRWVGDAARGWAAERGVQVVPPVMSATDATRLRALRGRFSDLIGGVAAAHSWPCGSAALNMSADGTVRWQPQGKGWQWVAAALSSEILLAQHSDTLRRLKTCRNRTCQSCFYDRSKNNSGVWHDAKTCGNVANLRASRARRRAVSS